MKLSVALLTAVAGSVVARPSTLDVSTLDERLTSRQNDVGHAMVIRANDNPDNKKNAVNAVLGSEAKKSDGTLFFSTDWAGAVLYPPQQGFYTSITGRFKMPSVTRAKPAGYQAMDVMLSIDDVSNCPNGGSLEVGVKIKTSKSGATTYEAWYYFYPNAYGIFKDFPIKVGDVIQMDVTTKTAFSGTVMLTNLSNRKTVSKDVSGQLGLCRASAAWVVAHTVTNGKIDPFNNFGTITLSHLSARLNKGAVRNLNDPSYRYSILRDDPDGGVPMTHVAYTGPDSLTVQYIGDNPF
ncbi:hypothetical protein ACEQ8H_001617 [Pleosporales sp. CAS-2024a]